MSWPRIPVAPNAAGGIHVLGSDVLQHLELFARDPGDTILGEKNERETTSNILNDNDSKVSIK